MKKENDGRKLLTILMIICVTLSIAILAIVSYDKLLKEKDKDDVKPTTCNCPACTNTNLGEKITSVREIKLTDKNQEIKVGSKNYKVRVNESGELSVDDYFVHPFVGDGNISVQSAYLTDKYMFFIQVGQDGESIAYAIGENGEIVANNNDYQMIDFKVIDDYLHASGHVFCGLNGDCPDKDLLIKFVDNTLIVTEAK